MKQRSWAAVTTLALGAAVLGWALAHPPAMARAADKDKPKKETPGKDVFGLTKVWHFDLQVSAKGWETMQPAGGMRFPGGPGGPPRPAEKPGEKPADTHKGSGFGIEFPFTQGEVAAEGKTSKDVGLRFKGNASYMASARGLKRNFKLEFDHYDDQLRFHGLKTLNLNAGAMDPTKMRESLSFAVFRAAGVPAPRTAYAEVTLTIPGKYDKEYLGLYTVIEQVDKTFLKDRFKNNKGLLMKPEGVRGIDYLGEDWERYKGRYKPKHEPSAAEARRVIEFAKLVHRADDEQFKKEIASYLDVDEFLRFLAVNAFVVNMDSFFSMGHNYYIYLNPETNKFVYIPWDLDLSMAGFGMMGGTGDQQLDLSLTHPHMGQNKLIDRLLAIPEVKEHYQKLLKELAATAFAKGKLLKDIDAIEQATKDITAKEKRAAAARKEGPGGFGPGMMGRTPDLRNFVAKRTESVAAQVEGKSKGYVPMGGFGPGGRPGGPGGFGPGNFWAKPLLEALDANKDGKVTKDELVAGVKKFFNDCDKDRKGSLDEKALAAGLDRLFPRPPGFGPPGGPGAPPPGGPPGGRPGGPVGFGPGAMLAGVIVKRADTNKDGKVTLEELTAAAEALFKECDKDKKGSLGEKEIAAGINLLFPPPPGPPGFGPPPGRPEEPKKEEKKP